MSIYRSVHTVRLENGYELHIIREDRNKKLKLSLDKRSDQGWVRERITIEIPFDRAYRMAKYICGIIEVTGMDLGDTTETRILDELRLDDFCDEDTAEFPPDTRYQGNQGPGEDPGEDTGD